MHERLHTATLPLQTFVGNAYTLMPQPELGTVATAETTAGAETEATSAAEAEVENGASAAVAADLASVVVAGAGVVYDIDSLAMRGGKETWEPVEALAGQGPAWWRACRDLDL